MSKTLLNAVNEVLKRVGEIAGDSGALTTLTDSPRQAYIDLAVQIWNEVSDELYTAAQLPLPNILSEATITLVTNDRDYALASTGASGVSILHWPLRNETTGMSISEYPGGYMAMVRDQLTPANYTGLALQAAIRPSDAQLYLERIPTSAQNGLVYKYRYEKDGVMSAATDTMPFSDKVFRAVVPAVAELWRERTEHAANGALAAAAMARAARLLSKVKPYDTWGPRVGTSHLIPDWGNPYGDAY